MVDGVFVRALNENRTRGLPLRRRTLYPLSYKGVASFRGLGVTPEPLYVRYNKHRIECRGKINSTCCRQAPPPGFEPGPKVPKTRVLPLHQGGMRANASDTYARPRSAMPIQPVFADWIPGPVPWPITADRLADGARVELARDFRPNSLSRTAPLPHGPPSMPVFAIQGHTG